MPLAEELTRLRVSIEDALDRFIDGQALSAPHPEVRSMLGRIREFNARGGKKIRGALMVLGYRGAGGDDEEAAVEAAVALEFLQDFLLFHDDIMDESAVRRGGPTLHEQFRADHVARGWSGAPGRYGESMGILGGDLAESFGVMALASSAFPEALKTKAVERYARTLRDTGYGQIMDLVAGTGVDVGESDVLAIHEYKTAKYTFEAPLQIGAILGGADDRILERLSAYAIPVGIAFQVHDDILGLFGTEEEIGKPITSDLAEGKRTLLIVHALERGSAEQAAVVRSALGKPNLGPAEVEAVRAVVRDTGALGRSQSLARALVDQGTAALDGGWLAGDVAPLLRELANYVIRRSY